MTGICDFSNRSALVTGAASGIGAACARWLDQQGVARLVLVDMDAAGLEKLELNCNVQRVVGSVADPDLWDGLTGELAGIDHAVVNAGIANGMAPFLEHSLEAWRAILSVNLDGAFLTLRAAMQAMKASAKGGSVVIIASVTGVKPIPGTGAYGVSKAAVAHMARIAAAEGAADKIRVNAIAPGGVDTPIWESSAQFRGAVEAHGRAATIKAMAATTPRGTYATADEIAGQIGYLLSDDAANITGHVLVSDGGFSL